MIKIINIALVLILFGLLILLTHIEGRIPRNQKSNLVIFIAIFMSILLAYRDIGLDLEPYKVIYDSITVDSLGDLSPSNIFYGNLEPGFFLLVIALKKLGLGFNQFLLFSALIPIALITKIITRVNDNIITTFCLFTLLELLIGPITTIRHFFAAALYLYGLLFFAEGKNKQGWLIIISSILFHYSNIILLPLIPFIKKMHWNVKAYFLSILTVTIAGITASSLITYISSDLLGESDNVIIFKAIYYLTYANSADGYNYLNRFHEALLWTMNIYPLVISIAAIILSLSKRHSLIISKFDNLTINSQILGTLLALFLISIGALSMGTRINFLLSIGGFIIIGNLLQRTAPTKRIELFAFFIFALLLYNFLVISYFAGIHDPQSPFSLV